jgi:hypothetical protein
MYGNEASVQENGGIILHFSRTQGVRSFPLESIRIPSTRWRFETLQPKSRASSSICRWIYPEVFISISDRDSGGGGGGGRRIDQKIADATTPIRARPRVGR